MPYNYFRWSSYATHTCLEGVYINCNGKTCSNKNDVFFFKLITPNIAFVLPSIEKWVRARQQVAEFALIDSFPMNLLRKMLSIRCRFTILSCVQIAFGDQCYEYCSIIYLNVIHRRGLKSHDRQIDFHSLWK